MFQRARTALEADKRAEASEHLAIHAFTHHLKDASHIANRKEMVRHIEAGHFTITQDRSSAVLESISLAMETVPLISDLDFCVLRNHTDYPFVFSDSPVIFYNTCYRNVTTRGVLGLETPGLQVVLPLDSDTLLMLFDESVYSGDFEKSTIVDIYNRSDVSQLNALQLHHHLQAVYFSDDTAADYVLALWHAHKSAVSQPKITVTIRKGWLLDGKPVDEVLHSFEPQLNLRLNLSFVHCTPIAESEYEFRRRSASLHAEQKARDAIRSGEKRGKQ